MDWREIFDSVGLLYVLESAPFAASIAVDEKFVWCNEAFLHLIKAKDPSEVIGQWAHQFLDPEFLPAVRERVSRLIRGESNPPMEMGLLRQDGIKTYAEVRSVPFDARGKKAYVTLLTDITISRADLESRLDREMSRLMTETTLVPVTSRGRVAGFTLSRVPAGTILETLGLQAGDVLVSVNETSIDSFTTLVSLWP